MIQNAEESKIDLNLYSRQLGIIDINTMKKLTKMNFLIIGLRGLGIEILKNLILEGPNRVDIYDPNYITLDDLNSNYFITEKDINKIRDETIIEKIKNLNPNVECKVLKDIISNNENTLEKELLFITSNIPNYNMIIISEFTSKSILKKLNEECRKLNKGLIYTCSLGLCGFLFNDFGKEHIISNPFDEDDNFYPIKDIKQGEKTIIILENSLEGFPKINDENFIKLINIKGMIELNTDIIYKPKYISASEYEININSTNFNKYTYGGFLKVIFIQKKIKFKSFEEDILNPMKDKEKDLINIPYIGRRDIVHSLIYAMHYYENENKIERLKNKRSFIINSGLLPELNDINRSKELTEIAKTYYNNSKNNKENWILTEDIYDEESKFEEFDENMSINLSLYLKAELPPFVSFLGGVVAQEIIKITGKFIPFNQWFEFEFNYLSKKYNKDIVSKEINKNKELSRYNEQIQIFGKDVQNKLASLNIFLVGCGAIGCEYLKNFSMMGISCKKDDDNKGVLTITDFDKIELSNLNRQFLFRENNIGQFKSEVSKHFINIINNSCHIKAYTNFVGQETENVFSDDFWENQDIIFNAVDNVKARMYISEKVSIHKKYHVDAGTLGVESSCCYFLKNISSTYKEQNFGKKEDEDNNGLTGMCTIHAFPTSIKHCIEWARNEYSTIFSEFINELNQIINGNFEYLYKILIKKIFPFYKNLEIENINNYFDILIDKSYIKAIQYSFIKFKFKFHFYIKDILKEHPEDSKDKNGNNFYTGSKHVPIILDLNINDKIDNLILCYVKSYSNLIFDTFGLIKSQEELKLNDEEIKQICLNTNIPDYENINKNCLISKINYNKQFCKNFVLDLKNKLLAKINNLNEINLKEITFSKDNITNSQYNFIYACCNLKAINFQIPQCDFLKVRSISSKIVPSIITSNAVITGLSSMQLYLLARLIIEKENNNEILNNDEALKLFRNYYINLGINSYQFSYLPKALLHNEKIHFPKNWTEWDSLILNGPLNISEFIINIEEKYKVSIKSIHSEKSMIYNENDSEEIKNFKVEDIFEKITKTTINHKKKYLILYLSAKTRDGIEAKMPRIIYNLFF